MGRELWKSDGTASGTVNVKDVPNGSLSSGARDLTNVNGTIFFVASSSLGNQGYELFKTDGTVAGTTLVKEMDRALLQPRLPAW